MANESVIPPRQISDLVAEMVQALDSGTVTAEDLRLRAQSRPDWRIALNWVDFAVTLHEHVRALKVASCRVKDPGFRKGTGMKPVSWKNCLWKPAGGMA